MRRGRRSLDTHTHTVSTPHRRGEKKRETASAGTGEKERNSLCSPEENKREERETAAALSA